MVGKVRKSIPCWKSFPSWLFVGIQTGNPDRKSETFVVSFFSFFGCNVRPREKPLINQEKIEIAMFRFVFSPPVVPASREFRVFTILVSR